MSKLKSNRGAAKRFRKTGSGKVRRGKSYHRHILTKKTRKRKRNLRQPGLIHGSDEARVKKMLLA